MKSLCLSDRENAGGSFGNREREPVKIELDIDDSVIPEGFRIVAFREPRQGERFVSIDHDRGGRFVDVVRAGTDISDCHFIVEPTAP